MKKIIIALTALLIIVTAHTAFAANIQEPSYGEMKNSPAATRSEFCGLAYNLLNVRLGTELTGETGMFTDTDKAEVCTLASLGIISGRGNGIFDPGGLITREEAARILCSLMDFMGIEDREIVDEQFKDFDTVSDWAKEYVAKVARNEIMEGNGDGYVYNYAPEHVNTPKDTFHLYNSDFGPHQNYTVWQTQRTLYNLSCLLPERTGNENVTEYENVTIYSNKEYIWAEKNGRVILSKPHNWSYKLGEFEKGHYALGYERCVYDLDTGKRLMKLRHTISDMNSVMVTTEASFDMSFAGLTNTKMHYQYDYGGIFIEDIPESSNGKPAPIIDEDGNEHYILYDEASKTRYLTEVYSLKPLVSGKSSIEQKRDYTYEKAYPYFICTEQTDNGSLCQIYDFNGRKIFESGGKIVFLNNKLFVSFDGDNSFVGRTSDGEKLFAVKGTEISIRDVDYFFLRDENTGLYSAYLYDGKERDEICDGFEKSNGWDDIITVQKDNKSYILSRKDLSRIAVFDGSMYCIRENYCILQRGEEYVVIDRNWKEVMTTNDDFSYFSNIIATHPKAGEGDIKIYDTEDFKLIWSDTAKKIAITSHYILTKKDDRLFINNVLTGVSAEITGYSSRSVKEEYGIAGVVHDKETTLYNENCEELYTGESDKFKWNSKYVRYMPDGRQGLTYLYDLNGNDTGIAHEVIEFMTIHGKSLIIVSGEELEGSTLVYDYETANYLFTIKGRAYSTGLLMFGHGYITTLSEGEQLYYDENGNRVDISENE